MTRRVLFVTTNGVGLGHLTRSMAIARRLDGGAAPIILTMSQAVPVVRDQGFLVEYLPSASASGVDRYDWHLLLEARIAELCAVYDPAVVVFDGTSPYPGLCARVVADRARAWVWCRRAMWRPGVGAGTVRLSAIFDEVLEPGELAAPADRGATVAQRGSALRVGPVLLARPGEALDRAGARAELGLPAEEPCALLQLGAGSINDVTTLRGVAATALRERGVRVVVAESPLTRAPAAEADGVVTLRRYPIQPLLAAFDLAVAAPGYNSFHELVAAAVPTVFAPNLDTQTDDQLARARFAERAGFARSWEDASPEGFARAVEPLLDPGARRDMAAAAPRVDLDEGAAEAASALGALADGRSA